MAGTSFGGHSNCIFSDDGASGRWSDSSADSLSVGDGAKGSISNEGDSESGDNEGFESVSKNKIGFGDGGSASNRLGTFISFIISMSSLRVTSCVEDAQV